MESFAKRLNDLGWEAFETAKKKLTQLGGSVSFTEEDNYHLFIDPCNGCDYIYRLDVRKVLCEDNILIIIGNVDDKRMQEILSEQDDWPDPDEMWTEGGAFYAEWEGLFDLIDAILDK